MDTGKESDKGTDAEDDATNSGNNDGEIDLNSANSDGSFSHPPDSVLQVGKSEVRSFKKRRSS